jgi:hypothetical protein
VCLQPLTPDGSHAPADGAAAGERSLPHRLADELDRRRPVYAGALAQLLAVQGARAPAAGPAARALAGSPAWTGAGDPWALALGAATAFRTTAPAPALAASLPSPD